MPTVYGSPSRLRDVRFCTLCSTCFSTFERSFPALDAFCASRCSALLVCRRAACLRCIVERESERASTERRARGWPACNCGRFTSAQTDSDVASFSGRLQEAWRTAPMGGRLDSPRCSSQFILRGVSSVFLCSGPVLCGRICSGQVFTVTFVCRLKMLRGIMLTLPPF